MKVSNGVMQELRFHLAMVSNVCSLHVSHVSELVGHTSPPADDASQVRTAMGTRGATHFIRFMPLQKNYKASEAIQRRVILLLRLLMPLNLTSCSLPKRGECMETSAGHKLLMSGGYGHSGIGICGPHVCSKHGLQCVFFWICSLTFQPHRKQVFICARFAILHMQLLLSHLRYG